MDIKKCEVLVVMPGTGGAINALARCGTDEDLKVVNINPELIIGASLRDCTRHFRARYPGFITVATDGLSRKGALSIDSLISTKYEFIQDAASSKVCCKIRKKLSKGNKRARVLVGSSYGETLLWQHGLCFTYFYSNRLAWAAKVVRYDPERAALLLKERREAADFDTASRISASLREDMIGLLIKHTLSTVHHPGSTTVFAVTSWTDGDLRINYEATAELVLSEIKGKVNYRDTRIACVIKGIKELLGAGISPKLIKGGGLPIQIAGFLKVFIKLGDKINEPFTRKERKTINAFYKRIKQED